MLVFDQLRIDDDGKKMYIDIHVSNATYFNNVLLDSITVLTADQVSETTPDVPTDGYIYKKTYSGGEREDHLVLDKAILDAAFNNTDSQGEPIHDGPTAKVSYGGYFSNDLLFVYVKCKTIEPDSCFCNSENQMTTLGVTFDEALLYQKVMQFTKELADNCTVSKGFIDMILLWYGFKASIETEHYIEAIDFWKKMFFGHHGVEGLSTYKPCGCHG